MLVGHESHHGIVVRRLRHHRSVDQLRWWLLDLLLGLPVLVLLLFASEGEARAYTDPGSGALIWQMLVAGLVGAAFYFRKFTSWLRRKQESRDVDQPAEEKRQEP